MDVILPGLSSLLQSIATLSGLVTGRGADEAKVSYKEPSPHTIP